MTKCSTEFKAEIQSTLDGCSPQAIEVIYCDASIQKVEEFTPDDAVRLESLGGSGTEFRPVFENLRPLRSPPIALVYLTDGYGSFPAGQPEYAVLWEYL